MGRGGLQEFGKVLHYLVVRIRVEPSELCHPA
jgi:hypothetical protein